MLYCFYGILDFTGYRS